MGTKAQGAPTQDTALVLIICSLCLSFFCNNIDFLGLQEESNESVHVSSQKSLGSEQARVISIPGVAYVCTLFSSLILQFLSGLLILTLSVVL